MLFSCRGLPDWCVCRAFAAPACAFSLSVILVSGILMPAGTAADESRSVPSSESAAVVPVDANSTAVDAANRVAIRESTIGELALEEGKSMYRGLCSGCHGGAARGGKGPDLTDDRWLHGSTDDDIARVIQNGVPGTTMKKLGESLKEEQVNKIIAYVRSLAKRPGESDWQPYMAGDPAAGKQLFFDPNGPATCNQCHALGGQGGGIGPALDRIASRRAGKYIMESMVQPSIDIDPTYEQLLVVTNQGKLIRGLRINESNFTVQLREENGQFHSFQKRNLEEVQAMETSMMPDNLVDKLTVKQLHDLFAFLMTLE